MGHNYTIEYKKGKENKAADALSRQFERTRDMEKELHIVKVAILPQWIEEIQASYLGDEEAQGIMVVTLMNAKDDNIYTVRDGVLRYKNKIWVGKADQVRRKIMETVHDSSIGGHSGIHGSYQKAKKYFYWKGMKKDIQEFVEACDVCKQCKSENVLYPGMLQPLPIPEKPWSQVTMDFIEALPNSEGRSVIWVVVDRITKYSHFIALKHPYTAENLTEIYYNQIHKLPGFPEVIVSDRDVVF